MNTIERQDERHRQIRAMIKSIQKNYTDNRSKKEEFHVEMEPYIREGDEATQAEVERRQEQEEESESENDLKKDDLITILKIIKILGHQLEEINLPLKKISLKSCSLPLSGESIEQIVEFIKSCPSIQSFVLRFFWCGVKMPPKFIFCLQNVSTQLIELYLHFGLIPEHAEQCISNLAHTIDACRNLESLHLDGQECEGITNSCLFKMGKMAQRLEKLRTFVIKLRQSQYINEKGITDFGIGLSKVNNITHLEMSFYYFMNAFTRNSMHALGSAISNAHGLETLTLDFSWCSDIVDEAAQVIINSINHIQFLKTLTLNLSGSTRITDMTLECIGQMLVQKEFISKLTLEFGNCEMFTDQGIQALSRSFLKCINIEELTLDIQSCYSITDVGIESICSSILNLVKLRDLYFSTHEFLSAQTQDLVNNMMKAIQELEMEKKNIMLSLFMMNKYAHLLKRKDLLNDIAF